MGKALFAGVRFALQSTIFSTLSGKRILSADCLFQKDYCIRANYTHVSNHNTENLPFLSQYPIALIAGISSLSFVKYSR